MTDESGVLWIPNSNFFADREGHTASYVIVHGTAGGTSAQGIADYFVSTENTSNPVSSNYIVDQAGSVVQTVLEKDGAWANGGLSTGHDTWWSESINPNDLTISIECVKASTDNSDALTTAQFNALVTLVQHICARHNIPMRAADASGGITGHFSIDPVNRSQCPGTFDWSGFFAALNNTTAEDTQMIEIGNGIGKYFTDKGNGRWHCDKTNVDFIGANLTFWRQNGGLGGLPLTNEIYLSAYAGTAIVVCERWIQVSDPGRRIDNPPVDGTVYLLHLDSGIGQQMIAKALTDPLQTQITALVAQIATLKAQDANLQAELNQSALEAQINTYKARMQQIQALTQ